MGKSFRTEHAGAVNHVTHHGANNYDVFLDDVDRYIFLAALKYVSEKYDVQVVAYCLMGNHFHLLLRCTSDKAMRQAMQLALSNYTLTFNKRHRRSGALFRGRYASFFVDTDSYLMWVSRYIHLNPVKDGFTKRAEDWRWSSYRAYVGLDHKPMWLHPKKVFELIPSVDRYRAFVERPVDGQRQIPATEPFLHWSAAMEPLSLDPQFRSIPKPR